MTLPRIFRIHSRKSLKSHDRANSEPAPAVPAPPTPPVAFPTPELPATQTSNGHAPPLTSSHSEPGVKTLSAQDGDDQEPVAMPSILVFPTPEVAPVPTQTNGHAEHTDDSRRNSTSGSSFLTKASAPAGDDDALMAQLTVITADINSKRSNSKIEQALNAFDGTVSMIQGKETTADTYLSPVKSIADLDVFSGVKKTVEEGVNSFLDGIPVLMKALDEVAKIHPFIAVAVLAFKAVYKLETQRRANEKKVVALYVEMKDMISVLLQLKSVQDPLDVGPDGVTIQGRLQALVNKTADDLKDCANACDAYCKMRLLAKVLKGPLWDGTLAGFAGTFTKRRADFEFALSIHVGRGVDEANRKLDNLAADLKQKTDMLMKFMQSFVSPEQKALAALVQQKGGAKAVMDDDDLLRELSAQDPKGAIGKTVTVEARNTHSSQGRAGRGNKDDLEQLKTDLRADPAATILTNMQTFERKFAMQQRQIVEDVDRVITRQSDRIIESVTSGPHDKVVDKDLYTIWKDMGWRGSVKARHFVLALRDYYHDRADDKRRKEASFEVAAIADPDAWAFEYLSVKRLQQIIDAFDEDASGFITVAEANKLIAARPIDWSLPHWVAYWSVGWQIMASDYINKIYPLVSKMFQLKDKLNPANIHHADVYLDNIWYSLVKLTLSMRPYTADDDLIERFKSFNDAEEGRIRKNLEAIHYDIDDLDTLTLVTGPGRIERNLFPLLYLLLKRDFEIFRIARTKVLNRDELWDSADTILYVFDAVGNRYRELADVYTQQKLDVGQQFKAVYSELFDYWHEPMSYFSRENMRGKTFVEYDYVEEEEAQDVDPSTVLNYPLEQDYAFDCEAYDVVPFTENEDDTKAEGILKTLTGKWFAMVGEDGEWPSQSMFYIDMHVSADGEKLEGTGKTPEGTPYTTTGTIETKAEGQTIITLTQKYAARFGTKVFLATLTDTSDTVTGVWGYGSATDSSDKFVMSRLSPDILSARPPPADFEENRIKALWKFATCAVRDQVRKQLWSWSHFKERHATRNSYLELLARKWDYGHLLDDDENAELVRCRRTLSPADARFYETIYEFRLRTARIHLGITCDGCGGIIGGTRTICIDCDKTRTLDLCDDERCISATVGLDKRDDLSAPHVPSHSVFKVRKPVHMRDFGKLDEDARTALSRAREARKDVNEVEEEQAEGAVEEADKTAQMAKDKLACIVCKKRVSLPCWYCISCSDDTFLCLGCDPKDGITVKDHSKDHPLVKVQEETEEEKPVTTEDRLEAMERKFTTLDEKVAGVDERLSRIENLLHLMLGHFGVSAPQETQAILGAPTESQDSAQLEVKKDGGEEVVQAVEAPAESQVVNAPAESQGSAQQEAKQDDGVEMVQAEEVVSISAEEKPTFEGHSSAMAESS